MGSISDNGALIGERVECAGNETAILDEEDDLGDWLLDGETLEESADEVLGTLALHATLLVGGSLLDLGDDAVAVETTVADRVEEKVSESV